MNDQIRRTVLLHLNTEDVEKKMKNLVTRLENARREKEALEKRAATGSLTGKETLRLRDYTKEVAECEKQLAKTRATKSQVDAVLKNMSSAGPRELKNTLRALNKELESGSVKRGTKEWDEYQRAIREVKTELREINKEQKATGSSWSSFDRIVQRAANIAMTLQGTWQSIKSVMGFARQHVDAYAQMEEAMADVRKYTGMTTEQVEDLNEALKQMDTRTAREQLNALAGDAGRLGIESKEQILEFVEAADQINVALGEDLGEDAVKNIGKLAKLYGDDQVLGLKQAMLATGSAINEVAQNSSASEPYLLDFTARLAGVGKQAGISQADIMGFAAALDEGMLRDEMASTALQQLIVKIFQKPQEMARAAGLEVKAFSELVKTDANAALLQFFQSLKAQGGFESLAPMFEEMHLNGQRAVGVLSSVADRIDDVRSHQELANKAYQDATSITDEFNVKNNTVEAQLEKARKKVQELSFSLGKELYPIMTKGIHLTSTMMKVTITLIRWIKEHKTAVVSLIAAYVSYKVSILSIRAAMTAWHAVQRAATATTIAYHAAIVLCTQGLAATGRFLSLCTTLVKSYTSAQKAATVATEALDAAQTAMSLGLKAVLKIILRGVIAIGTYIGVTKLLSESTASLTEAEEDFNKSLDENRKEHISARQAAEAAKATVADETTRVRTLMEVMNDGNRSYAERRAALEELKRTIPGFNATLSTSGQVENANVRAVENYIAALQRRAVAEAFYDRMKERMQQIVEVTAALREYQRELDKVQAEQARNFPAANRLAPQSAPGPQERLLPGYAELSGNGGVNPNINTRGLVSSSAIPRQYGLGPLYNDDAYLLGNWLQDKADHWQGLIKTGRETLRSLELEQKEDDQLAKELGVDVQSASLPQSAPAVVSPTQAGGGGSGKGGRGGNGGKTGSAHTTTTDPAVEQRKKDLAAIETETQRLLLAERMRYETGQENLTQWDENRLHIEREGIVQQRDLYENGSKEWIELEQQRLDKDKEIRQIWASWSLADLEREQSEENAAALRRRIDGITNEEQYQKETSEIHLRYLRRRAAQARLYGLEEAQEYQSEYHEAELAEQLKRRQQAEELLKKWTEEFKANSFEEQKETEIAALEQLYSDKLISEEEYQRFRLEIIRKYNRLGGEALEAEMQEKENALADFERKKKEEDEKKGKEEDPLARYSQTDEWSQSVLNLGYSIQNLSSKLKDGAASWEDYAAVAMGSMAMISAAMSSLSSYVSACSEAEQAEVSARAARSRANRRHRDLLDTLQAERRALEDRMDAIDRELHDSRQRLSAALERAEGERRETVARLTSRRADVMAWYESTRLSLMAEA